MARTLDLGPHLTVHIGDDGVAEVVFGPAGGMPATDAREGLASLNERRPARFEARA